jgi:hypothetical protein
MAGAYERNLVLVHTPHLQARTDFEAIKAILGARAPDIEVFVVANDAPNSVSRRRAADRPTLVFSPVALRAFRPARGRVYAGKSHPKSEEYKRLAAAGIRVPECVVLQPHTRLDPATWGPFTILKPNVGAQGGGVRVQRTSGVRWVDPFSWPPGDPRYGRQMLAQRFVDTGACSTSYRVLTVLGARVYCIASRSVEPRPFRLDPAGTDVLDHPVASNSGERVITLEYDEDIIRAGTAVARTGAFPDIPVLGVDVIREEGTGALYVLEANPGGQTWSLSSDYGRALFAKHDLDVYAQFGALDVIADAMIEATRREAV